MRRDVVLVGVGGQGVLAAATVLAEAARHAGLEVSQSEVHGMAQRGGVVSAHLRLADRPVEAPLVGRGAADLVVALEPVEALRAAPLVGPDGWIVTATEPVPNVPDYPTAAAVDAALDALGRVTRVDAGGLARRAGSARAANLVVAGAAARRLPLGRADLDAAVGRVLGAKGEAVVRVARAAVALGWETGG